MATARIYSSLLSRCALIGIVLAVLSQCGGGEVLEVTDLSQLQAPASEPPAAVTAEISLEDTPSAVTADPSGVWVGDQGGTVSRIDPRGDRIVARIDVGHPVVAIALGADSAWVAYGRSGDIARIRLDKDAVSDVVHTNERTIALTFARGALWVASDDRSVLRVDPDGLKVRRMAAPRPIIGLTEGPDGVAALLDDGWIVSFEETRGKANSQKSMGEGSFAGFVSSEEIDVGPIRTLWVGATDGRLSRLGTGSNGWYAEGGTRNVGTTIEALSATSGRVWASGGRSLVSVDPTVNGVRTRTRLDQRGLDLAAIGLDVWATFAHPPSLKRYTPGRVPDEGFAARPISRNRPKSDSRIAAVLDGFRVSRHPGFDRIAIDVIGNVAPGSGPSELGYEISETRPPEGSGGKGALKVRVEGNRFGAPPTSGDDPPEEVDEYSGARVGERRVVPPGRGPLINIVRTDVSRHSITWALNLRGRPRFRLWVETSSRDYYCSCLVVDVRAD